MLTEPTISHSVDEQLPEGSPTWRSYFCDEVFTTPGEAGDHFGAALTDKPGCLIDYRVQVEAGTTTQRGRGLLMALRRAEAELGRYREEDSDLHRAMHRMEGDHRQALLREEEEGYARGLRDGMNLAADSHERATIAGVIGAPDSLAAALAKGYSGSTMVSDPDGAKLCIFYDNPDHGDPAHNALMKAMNAQRNAGVVEADRG